MARVRAKAQQRSNTMVKTAWERDDSAFMLVEATVRDWLPS